jgi:hypothetical protein
VIKGQKMNRVTITNLRRAGPGKLNSYLVKIIDADLHIGARVPVLASSQAEAGQLAWACFDKAIGADGRLHRELLGAV